ncbi:hypothetical protein [Burkholderia sp. WSM2232]|uniref:hypothetical protein n=1 Tax=Burkholderia sp. WSM2232 TaxID=944436 RepID=UPI0003FD9ACA|nr:hypothetical protein [Burkholderia sp. WSM2232]
MTSKKRSAPPSVAKQTDRALDSTESRLDEALEESFPASDPIAVHERDAHRASESQPQTQPQQPIAGKKRR